jgi:cysteinylglycine-S-conjugate dipeptidase
MAQPPPRADADRMRRDLAGMVAIPSVGADPDAAADVEASADHVAAAFRAVGVPARVVTVRGGAPAVIGHRPGPMGAPRVLLYAHHDVQPVGDASAWSTPPFALVETDGRLQGRGSADDKGGIAVHLEALRMLGDAPVGISLLIEGEEESGSPTLAELLEAHRDELDADVVIAPDSLNDAVGVGTLTDSLRGLVAARISIRTAERAVHSGIHGGPVPDALGELVHVLASLTDASGAVLVDGIHPGRDVPDARPDADDLRLSATLLPAIRLRSDAANAWNRPSVTITGIDAPSTAGGALVLAPEASATVGIRLAPEDDPASAFAALRTHVARTVVSGAEVTVTRLAGGDGWRARDDDAVSAIAVEELSAAFGTPSTRAGVGGGIPFVAAISRVMPAASILVTGVQDPLTGAHGPDESVALATLVSAAEAEAGMLQRIAAEMGPAAPGGEDQR